MILEDIPPPITLIFTALIVGSGYLAFYLSTKKERFKEMKTVDKLMISLTIGTVSFLMINYFLNFEVKVEDPKELATFLLDTPVLFIFNTGSSIILMKILERIRLFIAE